MNGNAALLAMIFTKKNFLIFFTFWWSGRAGIQFFGEFCPKFSKKFHEINYAHARLCNAHAQFQQ